MRDNLQAMGAEQRHTFTATFERTGYKTKDVRYATYYQPTLLVNDVTDEQGKVLTDHLWFNYTLGFQKLGHLEKGDRLQFDGRITTYTKGYQGWDAELSAEHPIETDYKIERPTFPGFGSDTHFFWTYFKESSVTAMRIMIPEKTNCRFVSIPRMVKA